MSTLKVNALQNTSGTALNFIKQVVHVEKLDTFTTSASDGTFATVFSAQITPSATSSKILVIYDINVSGTATNRMAVRVLRGSTAVNIGDADSLRIRAGSPNIFSNSEHESIPVSQTFLDSPSTTSQITYNLQIGGESGGGTLAVNRNQSDLDRVTFYRGASNIVLMEVAG